MKKYLQYNASQYTKPVSEVEARTHGLSTETPPRGVCSEQVLDLSGKQGNYSIAMVTGQKWANEQDIALDLSSYGKQMGLSGQAEALDLSKPSTPKSIDQNVISQSYMLSQHAQQVLHQPQQLSQTPPSSSHSRAVAGQYSLLQAALNSNQSNSTLPPDYEKSSQSESRSRLLGGGMGMADASRSIRPFSSVAPVTSRPLGISVPHMALSNSSVAVVQGVHKPIAITTPRPHSSSVNTKSQATVSVSGVNQPTTSANNGHGISQSDYRTAYHGKMVDQPGPNIHSAFMKGNDNLVQRYVIRTPDGRSHVVGGQNYIQMEQLQGFPCPQCPKVFKTKAAMKLHTTVHKTSEERQYGCQTCHRRFLHRHHLIVHQRKHSGEKPFKCDACSKTFMAIFLLHKHLRKHVRENSPKSQISTKQLQQLHIKKMTGDGAKSHYEAIGNVSHPSIQVDDLVIVSDEEEVSLLSKDAESDKIKVSKKEEDVIKDINVSKETNEPNEVSIPNVVSAHVTGSPGRTDVLKNTSDPPLLSVENHVINEDKNLSKELSKASTNIEAAVKVSLRNNVIMTCEDTARNNDHEINSNKNETSNVETIPSDEVEKEVTVVEETVEVNNPFPEYKFDDEVELDFETGELKVMNKEFHEGSDENCVEVKEVNKTVTEYMVTQERINEFCNDLQKSNDELENRLTSVIESCSSGLPSNEKDFKTETQINQLSYEEEKAENKSNCLDEVRQRMDEIVDEIENKVQVHKSNVNNENKAIEMFNSNLFKSDGTGFIETETDAVVKNQNKSKDFSTTALDTKETNIGMFENEIEKCDNKMKKSQKRTSSENLNSEKNKVLKLQEKDDTIDKHEDTDLSDQTFALDSKQIERDSKCDGLEKFNKINKQTQKIKKKSKRAKCEICLRLFHSNHHLVLHMTVHKKNPMLQSLKKAKANQMKVLGYAGQTSFNCDICKKVFKFQKSLNSHMRVHSEKLRQRKLLSKAFRDFVTDIAPQITQNVQTSEESPEIDLNDESHVNTSQEGEQSLENTSMVSSVVAAVNQVDVESEPTMPHLYETMKIYKDLNDPPVQFIIGTDKIKRYVCHACDNTYTTKQKLRMHALIHKDNCFLCDICGKSFFRQVTLDKHIATHMLPRPHVCSVCKKSFIHRSSLMRHKVVHEKPSVPSLKQQVADVNFELKMLDTYTLLRQERIHMMQLEKMKELKIEPDTLEQKNDILDLSVRIKMEDSSCLPPVLSPANTPTTSHSQTSPANLSPPLITQEYCTDHISVTEKLDQINPVQDEPSDNEQKPDTLLLELDNKAYVERKKKQSINDEFSGPMNIDLDLHTFHKRSRKTRVYQTSCRVCKEKFPNVMLLKTHMTLHNTIETHLYECHVCNHRFTQSCSLLRHLKTSCQENRMKCMPCGKTFHRRNTYEQHMKLHPMGPPNLDGSFYDKRKDEAEIKEEIVDRESDIENNNTKINTDLSKVKTEILEMADLEPGYSMIKEDSNDSTDSDARTYLYSEGEVRDNRLSDFSDTELSSSESPKKEEMLRQKTNVSPNAMNLNFLSAVCSDIRNAEKEKELIRLEQEDRQKELETIEILANLKRGAIQNKSVTDIHPTTESNFNPTQAFNKNQIQAPEHPLNVLSFQSNIGHDFDSKGKATHNVIEPNKIKSPIVIPDQPQVNMTKKDSPPNNSSNDCPAVESLNQPVKNELKSSVNNTANLPKTVINSSPSLSIPQIPTVVLELAAEQERRRQEKMSKMLHNRMKNAQLVKSENPTPEQKLLHELSQMHMHNPIIQDRLSLLMKAQIPSLASSSAPSSLSSLSVTVSSSTSSALSKSSSSTASSSTSSIYLSNSQPCTSSKSPLAPPLNMPYAHSDARTMATTSHNVSRASMSSLVSSRIEKYISETQNCPQDLSIRKRPTENVSLPSKSRSSPSSRNQSTSSCSSLPPPPLVRLFHCELCGRKLYNEIDLHIHMREHGVSPNSGSQHLVTVSQGDATIHHSKGRMSAVTERTPASTVTSTAAVPKPLRPPTSLEISVNKTTQRSRLLSLNPSLLETQDSSSSLTGSDLSDMLPSPTTSTSSATGNLDILRQELRAKIYARRRSQGLEDLTVEFKQPEPTEMTEEEKSKLNFRRECNRQAAQRSRLRKKDLVDTLLEELHREEVVNSDLRRQMESLQAEKHSLLKVLDSHTCVKDKVDKFDVADKNDEKPTDKK